VVSASALIGYRYLHSSDRLAIASTSDLGPFSFNTSDAFNVTCDFHGVDLGLASEWTRGLWTLEWRGEIALGANLSSSRISGATTMSLGGVTTAIPGGGLLALSSNIGNTSQTRFSALPEVAIQARCQVAPQWQIVAGYDLLYWTNVQRAGGLIDTTVNPNLIPPAPAGGPQRPQPLFNTSPLLAQGFNVGVRYDY
jgi:putative beta barrel porin BBP7